MKVSCIVIPYVDLAWILHFTLDNHWQWLRDALPMEVLLVITGLMRVTLHMAV